MRRLGAPLAVGVGLATAGTAIGALSPSALYTRLLTTSMPESFVSAAFSNPKTSFQTPGADGKRHHVIGEVVIALDGPDPEDAIAIEVFPNAADARLDVSSIPSDAHIVGSVPGIAHSTLIAGSDTGKNAFGTTVTNGITDAVATAGNLLVQGLTSSTDSTESGDVPNAITLLRIGLKYAESVRSG